MDPQLFRLFSNTRSPKIPREPLEDLKKKRQPERIIEITSPVQEPERPTVNRQQNQRQ